MSAITDELAYKAAYCHMRARTAPSSEITTQWTLMADAWIHMARIHRRLGTQVVPQNLAWTAHDWADGPLTSAEAVPASGLAGRTACSANVIAFPGVCAQHPEDRD